MKYDSVMQVQKLRHRVATIIAPYQEMLLAFSGGLDSMVLLDIITALRDHDDIKHNTNIIKLRAVYINHRLNTHSNHWAVKCAQECRKRNVAFTAINAVIKKKRESLESAARNARYQILTASLKDAEVLLTAHHQDDQAETLLLAIKRGSGPTGMRAMAIDRPFRGHRLVRPLLECSRFELETYANSRNLQWIEDNSNYDLRFDRNFLRLQILPILRKRWPQFSATAARTAQLCAEQEKLLDEMLENTLRTLILPDGSLSLTGLTTMNSIQRAAVLRRWLASLSVRMPSRQKLACLWKNVALSRRDSIAQMQLDSRQQVRRFRDRLYVLPKLAALSKREIIIPWPKKVKKLMLPLKLGILHRNLINFTGIVKETANTQLIPSNEINATSVFSSNIITVSFESIVRAPQSDEQVSVRFGSVRGLLYINGRHRGRKLKKIWQELGVPPWKRGNIPLLFYNDQLIAALGTFVTQEGTIQKSQAQWHLIWQTEDVNVELNV